MVRVVCSCGCRFDADPTCADLQIPCPDCCRLHAPPGDGALCASSAQDDDQEEQAAWLPVTGAMLAVLLICVAVVWALLSHGGGGGGATGATGGSGTAAVDDGAGASQVGAGKAAGNPERGTGTQKEPTEPAGDMPEAELVTRVPESQPTPASSQTARDAEQHDPAEIEPEQLAIDLATLPPEGKVGTSVGEGQPGVEGIFEAEGSGRRIVYVIDRSGSMDGAKLARAKTELETSLRSLPEDKEFCILFYNTNYTTMPMKRLVPATKRNKEKMMQWTRSVLASGSTDPTQAMLHALELRPDTVWLLSDGEFNAEAAEIVRLANLGQRVSINTIAFFSPGGVRVLQTIAEQNNGIYRSVP